MKAVITILGTIGGRFNQDTKRFEFVKKTSKSIYKTNLFKLQKEKYTNTLPLLIDSFKDYKIIPIYTKDALDIQKKVLEELEEKKEYLGIFENGYEIKDENNFDNIFRVFDEIFNQDYDEFIVDVTHGFRHLPLLLLIEMLIKNFQNENKIKHILFAKEIIKPIKENNFSGEYEIIDLKDYLDLANVAFVLETFNKNYTISSHIRLGKKYKNLEECLVNFSNDILVLNIDSIFKNSGVKLIEELSKLKTETSIKNQVNSLIEHLEEVLKYKNLHRFYTYYKLANDLKEKGYLLNSLTLLYESVRLFLEYYLNDKNPSIMKKIRNDLNNDDYKIGDFCMNKVFKVNKNNIEKNKQYIKDNFSITFEEYKRLVNSIPYEYKKKQKCEFDFKYKNTSIFNCIAYARNNFAHAKKDNNYSQIKEIIDRLFEKYYFIISKYKNVK